MKAAIRRIDLTTDPVSVELWPCPDPFRSPPSQRCRPTVHLAPRGRGGLWEALARASRLGPEVAADPTDPGHVQAQVATAAPHLAYLARVAATTACGNGSGPDPLG